MKKFIGKILCPFLLFGVCVLLPGVKAEAQEATRLQTNIQWNNTDRTQTLSDDTPGTGIRLKADDVIQITANEKIAGLYIEWNTFGEEAAVLTYGSKSMEIGKSSSYIHEYISLDGSADACTITVSSETRIGSIYAFSKGELPSSVQRWETMEKEADIMVFPAFGCEETLLFGPQIATFAKDYKVQVMYLCKYDDSASVERMHELLDALWQLGVRYYPVNAGCNEIISTTYEAAKMQYDGEAIKKELEAALLKYQPLVVISMGPNKGALNSVHKFYGELLVEALTNTEDKNMVQKIYFRRHAENQILFPVEENLQLAKKAYTRFASLLYGNVSPTGDTSSYFCCAEFGLYKSTVGFDTGNDMLEHVKFRIKEEEKEEQESISSTEENSNETSVSAIADVKEKKTNILAILGVVFIVAGVALILFTEIYTAYWKIKKKEEGSI